MMGNNAKENFEERGIIIKTMHTQLYPYTPDFLGYHRLFDCLGCGVSIGKIVENTCDAKAQVNELVLFWGDFQEYQFLKEHDISSATLMHICSQNVIPFLFYDFFVIAFNVLETCQYQDVNCLSIGSETLLEKVIGHVLEDNGINVSYVKDDAEYSLIVDEKNGIKVRDHATEEIFDIEYETGKGIFNHTYWNEIHDVIEKLDVSDWIIAHVHIENIQFYLKTYEKEKLQQKALVMDW